MLECVINVSEGRDENVIDVLRSVAGRSLLDLHADRHHNRAVLTLAGVHVEESARAVTAEAIRRIDLRRHAGAHPRLGAVDVVPFVPLHGAAMEHALAARDRFAAWASAELGVPCFLYGPERPLPDVRREAFRSLAPDLGPSEPHETAGAICCGARPALIAYNLWLVPGTDVTVASRIATALRGPAVRALGLDLEGVAQVSLNLLDWTIVGPEEAYDRVAALAEEAGSRVDRAELVGLAPAGALLAIKERRWPRLGLNSAQTIEARLAVPGR
ncbi:MAG: Formiminotransferase domain protein [Acidimicrobiales bacterium]|nr:Formiminotransferase domain protein [Acidimicrobiales bacterium]